VAQQDDQPGDVAADLKIWVNRQPQGTGQLGTTGAVLKAGPHVIKTVHRSNYGDEATGEIRKRELRFRTHERRRDGLPGWDFDEADPKTSWWCENEQIDQLLAFLDSNVAKTGRYRVVDMDSPAAGLLQLLSENNVDAAALADALVAHEDVGQLVGLLALSDAGLSAAEQAVVSRRRSLVADLHTLIRRPGTTETDVQRVIGDAYWLFGGRYVGVADKRNLIPLDQHDIPLLGADGTLHIVELKGPHIRKLVRRHRNHWVVGDDVHEAVAQAMNYLRSIDEMGAALTTLHRNELGQEYDMRRAFATVVIGHPVHAEGVDEKAVQQTIRSYNAHLSRVEVITYKDLADTAERALAFEEESRRALHAPADAPIDSVPWTTPATADDPWASSPPPWDDEPPW